MQSIVIAWILALFVAAIAIGDVERGNRLYREGRYEAAVAAYRAALEGGESGPELRYNLGTALLRLGRYDEAGRHFEAALRSIEPELRQRTFYNLGNRFIRAGRSERDASTKRKLLDAAVAAYKQALRLEPGDADAKWNLELALDERRRLPSPPSSGGDPRQGRRREAEPDENRARARPRQGDGAGRRRPSPSSPEMMTREQADRILRAVAQDEQELLRRRLRRGSPTARADREW